jgi:DNA-binding MarR family transcriptional regulator
VAFSPTKDGKSVRAGSDDPLEPPSRRAIDIEDRRNLQALEAIAEDAHTTQRNLANRLGIALGLTNIYLKRLVRKGYVKCVNVQSNRVRYLLTPTGIAEKTRLTYEFMEYSLQLYGQVRLHLRTILEPAVHENRRRIALYGTGEAAELAYLSIKEAGLELAAIFDEVGGRTFLGMPVQMVSDHALVSYDLLLVAVLDQPDVVVSYLLKCGVPVEKLQTLRPVKSLTELDRGHTMASNRT